jgi:hypothetical protein
MTAIRITVTAIGEDFKTADRLIRRTLEERTDSISDCTGSSDIEVLEIDTETGATGKKYNYSQVARGEISL